MCRPTGTRPKSPGSPAQVHELTEAKAESAAEHDALARELPMLRQQLATAQQRYAEWDHQANEWEKQQAEWDADAPIGRSSSPNGNPAWLSTCGRSKSLNRSWPRLARWKPSRSGRLPSRSTPNPRRKSWCKMSRRMQPGPVGNRYKLSQLLPPSRRATGIRMNPRWRRLPKVSPEEFDWADKTSASPSLPAESEADLAPFNGVADSDAVAADAPDTDDDLTHFAEFSIWNQHGATEAPAPKGEAETAEAEVPVPERDAPAEPPAWDRHTPAWESETPVSEGEAPAGPISPENNSASADPRPALPTSIEATSAVAQPIQSDTPAVDDAPPTPEQRQPTSSIERDKHLFAEEDASGHAPPVTSSPPAVNGGVGKPRNMPVIRPEGSSPPAANHDAEESIEEYMAKLMQRVRGDKPFVPASQVSPSAVAPQSNTPAVVTPAAAVAPHVARTPSAPPTTASADRGGGTWQGTGSRPVRACP